MNRAKAVDDLKETFAILDADVKEVRKISDKEMSAFHVRTSIRTYSALIEGLLYQMRQVTLHSETDECKVFEFEEKMILNGKGSQVWLTLKNRVSRCSISCYLP